MATLKNTNRSWLEIRPEYTWADGGLTSMAAPSTPVFIPFLDGDYSVGLDDPLREQQHVVGDQDAQYIVQDIRNLAGDLKVGMWPHNWYTLLTWGVTRSSGELSSYAGRWTVPGIETRVHRGLMTNQLSIEGSNGADVSMTFGLMGHSEGTENGGSEATYPGTGGAAPDHVAYVIPEIASLQFKNCRFVISLDAGGTGSFSNRIKPVGLESFNITLANNLKVGPAIENRIDVTKDGAIEFLTAGRRKVDLRYTAAFDRLAYSTMQRNKLYTQFKLMAAHPYKTAYMTIAADAAAGTAVEIEVTVDPTGIIGVGDVVMFDAYGGTTLPCVATVTAIDAVTPFHITVDVLDEAVKAADHIFNGAIEIKTAPALVQSSTPEKPFDDFLKVSIQAQIFSGGDTPITFKCKDNSLS